MNAKEILNDQIVHIKRGRSNGLGFEPAFNSYFDFYLNSSYFGKPLLELADVTFHLYLRKNLNDRNKAWKMPTIRQMQKRFKIGQHTIEGMMRRLEQAYLLTKESGFKKGEKTVRNDYILSDPIPTLDEFLAVAREGLFLLTLSPEFNEERSQNGYTERSQNGYTSVAETATLSVAETATDQQTLNTKQTSGEQIDSRLEELRFLIGEKTFDRFLNGAQILSTADDTAVIGTTLAYAKDFIENRLSAKLCRALGVSTVRCVVTGESSDQ